MPELQEIKDDVKRILFYIENDPKTGREGLVTEVEALKNNHKEHNKKIVEFIAEYRQDQAVKRAKMGVIGAIGGALASAIWWCITHLSK